MLNKDKAQQIYALAEKTAEAVKLAEQDEKTFIMPSKDIGAAAMQLAALFGQLKETHNHDAAA